MNRLTITLPPRFTRRLAELPYGAELNPKRDFGPQWREVLRVWARCMVAAEEDRPAVAAHRSRELAEHLLFLAGCIRDAGRCFPSYATVGRRMGCSERTVQRKMAFCRRSGQIATESQGGNGKRGYSWLKKFLWTPMLAEILGIASHPADLRHPVGDG